MKNCMYSGGVILVLQVSVTLQKKVLQVPLSYVVEVVLFVRRNWNLPVIVTFILLHIHVNMVYGREGFRIVQL